MAESIHPSGKVLAIIFLVGVALTVWYLVTHSSGSKGVVKVVPPSTVANTNTTPPVSVGAVLGATTPQDLCAVRPKESYGGCGYFLGIYYSGSACTRVYGCELGGEQPPFFDEGSCAMQCTTAR